MFEISINSNKAWVLHRETLTRVGKNYEAQKVHLEFSDEWESLSKIAVFRALNLQLDVAVTGEIIDIPPAILEKAGVNLCLGLYGVASGGALVIPTIWADLGTIQPGADPWAADNVDTPTPALFAQMETLVQAAQAAAAAAASGVYAGSVDFDVDDDGHLIMSVTEEGETNETDLGAVTAYAAAVEGGYEGSYAEFQALLTANARTEYEVQAALDAVAGIRQLALDAHDDAAEALDTAGAAEDTADEAKGIAQAAQTAVAGKQAKYKTATVTLAANQSSWANLPATGVTASNLVQWGPAPGSLAAATEALVEMTAQGAGTVSFASDSPTTEAITINLVIWD